MALIVMPSLLSKRPWARIRARCEASFFIVLSKSARCCSVRGRTYLTLIALEMGSTYRIVLELERDYTKKLLVGHLYRQEQRQTQGARDSMYAGSGDASVIPACAGPHRGNPRGPALLRVSDPPRPSRCD